jgi:hypothetical protein
VAREQAREGLPRGRWGALARRAVARVPHAIVRRAKGGDSAVDAARLLPDHILVHPRALRARERRRLGAGEVEAATDATVRERAAAEVAGAAVLGPVACPADEAADSRVQLLGAAVVAVGRAAGAPAAAATAAARVARARTRLPSCSLHETIRFSDQRGSATRPAGADGEREHKHGPQQQHTRSELRYNRYRAAGDFCMHAARARASMHGGQSRGRIWTLRHPHLIRNTTVFI